MEETEKPVPQAGKAGKVIAVIALMAYVAAGCLFLFTMKEWGFSKPELAVMAAVIVLVGYLASGTIVAQSAPRSTTVLCTMVLVLMIAVMGLSVTVLEEWIKTFFVL